jgi:hypothetical protein
MPHRKKTRIVTVKHWEPLRKHWLYQGRIRSVVVEGTPDHLRAEIINLDPRELDRIHTVSLPLPARPGNRTCALFIAAGIDAKVGARIDLDRLVNRIVGFRLCSQATGESECFEFERFPSPPSARMATPVADSAATRGQPNVPVPDSEIPF